MISRRMLLAGSGALALTARATFAATPRTTTAPDLFVGTGGHGHTYPGATLPFDPDVDERAIYVVSGEIDIAGDVFGPGRLLVLRPGDRISILALSNARLMLIGGDAMPIAGTVARTCSA